MALSLPLDEEATVGLYVFACSGGPDGNTTNEVLAPHDWQPTKGHACQRAAVPEVWVLPTQSRSELMELELWHSESADDHWALASEASKVAAAALGYTFEISLGFVWPAP